jgi:hypothetical protein
MTSIVHSVINAAIAPKAAARGASSVPRYANRDLT